MSDFTPVDEENRRRIACSLNETLFVEAGAGTGKTKALVTRIVNLVRSGRTTIDRIAAITFTEAAAAELRERIRQELEAGSTNPDLSNEECEQCAEALRNMESASIQTLHSFAGAILRESPLEAGLPPAFEVVEEIEADLSFEEQWQKWLDRALQSDEIVPSLRTALELGLSIDNLKAVARSFHLNYDMLPEHFPSSPAPVPHAVQALIESIADIRSLLRLARNGPDDPLADYGGRVMELADRLAALDATGGSALAMLAVWGKVSFSKGRKDDWDDDPNTGMNGCSRLKELLKELEEKKNGEVELARRAALVPLLDALRQFVFDYAAERKSAGKAEFHDLLVWARDLLCINADTRGHFQRRFTHILIDEFQDTDPIQADIAFALCRREDEHEQTSCGAGKTATHPLIPGKLFVVGDPKQSIYRFRRADIGTMEKVREYMACTTLDLKQNFRSQEPILQWVNNIFQNWMKADDTGTQAHYSELTAQWKPAAATPPMGVHCLGECVEEKAGTLRRIETESIARIITDIKSGKWQVRQSKESGLRDAQYQDICILLPSRTGLPALERALENASVPYRVESQSLILSTQEIRELLSCLRAIDSPADQVSLIAALRSSAFCITDAELLSFLDTGGRFDYLRPGSAQGPVYEALDELLRFHRERLWSSIDELVERFIRERRLLESSFAMERPRERIRRLQFIIERARAFAQAGSNSLRSFLDWIERQADENARMVEIPVPECDEDAVRIMTVHGSKGLEFPIVILAGLSSSGRNISDPVIFNRQEGAVEVSISALGGPSFSTSGYELAKEREQAAEQAEDIRLMYVAATRAMDHLIVSLFHSSRSSKSPAAVIYEAALCCPDLWRKIDLQAIKHSPQPSLSPGEGIGAYTDSQEERDAWLARRAEVVRQAAAPAAAAVTAVLQVAKEEIERGEVYYRRGRGGTALGRAVHSVLQTVELDADADIDDICRAQAAAESIPDKWKDVAKLVRSGLRTETVKQAAASGSCHREVFISAPCCGRAVEGFIDLLFEQDGGLVIADYKTDMIEDDGSLPQNYEKYALQAGIYAFAVSRVTAKPIRKVVLIFLRSGREIVIEDIHSLLPQAEEAVRRGLNP